MPFKNTNRKAYKKAGKLGKTPKQKSKIYNKEKSKLESKSSILGAIKKTLLCSKKESNNKLYRINHRSVTPTANVKKIHKAKFVPQRLIIDDIRDYRSSKIISNISNYIAASFVKITCKNMTNDQMNFIRSTTALVASEVFNKALEKPLNIIDNIRMFIKVSKVVYKVVMYFDEKANEYCVDDSKTAIVKNNDKEYLLFLNQHPKIIPIEKRAEIIGYLGKKVFVKVDRILGSVHPKHSDIIYPVNYGFILNTIALDEEEQDAYVLGINEPIEEFKGVVKGIIIRKNDNEDKLIVCKENYKLTRNEILEKTMFQEQYFDIEIIM